MIKAHWEGIAITHPRVLYRYSKGQDKDYFDELFGDVFSIVFCDSNALALQAIQQHSFDVIFIEYTCLEDILNSPLLATDHCLPQVQKILLNADISLDGVIQLLHAQSLNKCFAKPYDANLIRSTVFAAQMCIQEPLRPRLTHTNISPSVLIVDDETYATKYLKKNLQNLGAPFDILCAADAQEALDLLDANKDSVAVIMSDHKMPGMQGSQLLNTIRNIQPNIVRILTSAYGEVDVALDAINEGSIFQYIKKPWDAEQVLVCINQALHKHQALLGQAQQSKAESDQRHQDIIDSRIARLTSSLGDKVDAVAGQGTLHQFFTCLSGIPVSASYAPAIRASHGDVFESDLVNSLYASMAHKLDELNKLSTLNSNIVRDFIEYAKQPEIVAKQSLSSYLYDELFQALSVLLNASGMQEADLLIDISATSITITPPRELKVYSHLLGPVKNISERFIQQQTALLVLFVITGVLQAELDLTYAKQSLGFSWRCSPKVGR